MADATPAVTLPAGVDPGIARGTPEPTLIGGRTFVWGSRTFLMGIVNVTPDSFSGDGLLSAGRSGSQSVGAAVAQAVRMAAEGADIVDVGGESSRPGHAEVSAADELARVVPVIRGIREALPDLPISIDTVKPAVAAAAVAAGADLINDVWGVGDSGAELARVAADTGRPLVVMHNRIAARYANVVAEVLADLERALERATAAGVPRTATIVDPGMGFGKTAEQNLAVFHGLGLLRALGRPILLGMSRKSTIGRVLDLPAAERLEGTLATTALGIAGGADIVRVHDVAPNHRAARMADAIVRQPGWEP